MSAQLASGMTAQSLLYQLGSQDHIAEADIGCGNHSHQRPGFLPPVPKPGSSAGNTPVFDNNDRSTSRSGPQIDKSGFLNQ